MQKTGAIASAKKNLAVALEAATAPRASRSATASLLAADVARPPVPPATPAVKPALSRPKITQVTTTVEKPKTPVKPAKTPARRITQRTTGAPAQTVDIVDSAQGRSDGAQEEEDSEAELQRARLADSVAVAVEARLASRLASSHMQPLRNAAPAADLVPPPWPGKLNLKADPQKLIVWLAARTKYIEVCRLSEHAPAPLHSTGTFSPDDVPTLRRWLGMSEGTCLCEDWLALTPALEAAIIPTLKARMEALSEETLRAELVALRIPHFASSWADLASAFDQYAAKWTVSVFKHKRASIELHTADLADIMKAHCTPVDALKHVLAGRCDDVVVLKAKVFAFLEQEESLSIRPGAAVSQRPPTDSRKGGSSVAFAATPPSHKTAWPSPSASPGHRGNSSPSSQSLRSAGIAKGSVSPAPSKKAVSLNAVGAAEVATPVRKLFNGCSNCGLAGHGMDTCALHTEFPFPQQGKGPQGTWRPGERAEFWAALPADVKERTLQRARIFVAARNAHKTAANPSATRVSPRSTVNRKIYLSFVARARLATLLSPNIAALADTGTPPNFISPALAAAALAKGEGFKVACNFSINAAGVHRGSCTSALRTTLWLKFKGAWASHPVDLLIFETGQPIILGYLSMVEWGWLRLERDVAQFKSEGKERCQVQAWLHAAAVVPSLKFCALEVRAATAAMAEADKVDTAAPAAKAKPRWRQSRGPRELPTPVISPTAAQVQPKRVQRRPLLSRAVAGAAAMAFVPVHILPSLAMLLFIAAVGQMAPAVQREIQAAGDALPSRYKGSWPELREKRRAVRLREAAEAGQRTGSVVAAAVVREVQTLMDALPARRIRQLPRAWQLCRDRRRMLERQQARAVGVPADGVIVGTATAVGRAVQAGAARVLGAAGLMKPEEKLRLRRKDAAMRRHVRIAGSPAVVQLAYVTGSAAASPADAEQDAFWRSPGMLQFQRDLRALEEEFGKGSGTRIFSKDLSTPSKMKAMVMRMKPGWEQGMRRQRPRHFTPPQEEWIEQQTLAMIRNKILSAAPPGAFVSCLHLAKKKPTPVPGGVLNLAYLGVCQGVARAFGGSLNNLPAAVLEAEQEAHLLAMDTPVLCGVDAQTVNRATGAVQSWRYCIDLREVNAWTVAESYPTPDIRKCLDRLVGNRIFGSIDCSAMYHQIMLSECSKNFIAFCVPGTSRKAGKGAIGSGRWRAERVQFGMKNACQHAQAAFNDCIRSDPRLDTVQNYLDDAALAAKTPEEFLVLVRSFFEMCDKFNIKLNASKTILGVPELHHLGFVVNERGCRVDEARIRVLTSLPRPKTVKQVQALVGAFNFVRAWVPQFSALAAPLTGMKTFSWGAAEDAALRQLQAAVAGSGLLYCIDYDRPIVLRCDASAVGCGGVLLQRDELGRERPIAWVSKKFSAVERRWNTVEAEAFAIVWSLQKLRAFVQGCPIQIETDSKNVRYINSASASNKVTRWRMILDEHEYVIAHIPGKTNSVDAISRLVSNAVPDEDVRTTLREEWLARNVECLHLGIAEAGRVFRLAGVLEGRNMGAQRVALASWLSSGAAIGLAPVQVSANFAPLGDKRWRCLHPCHAACEAPIASGSQTYHRNRYHAVAAPAAAGVLLESEAPPAVLPSAAGHVSSPPSSLASQDIPVPLVREENLFPTESPPVSVVAAAVSRLAELMAGPAVRWSSLDEASQLAVWESVHNSTVAGHLGAQAAFARICHLPFLLMMEKGEKASLHRSCNAFRSACMVCQSRRNREMDEGDIALSAIPTAPWGEISVDTLLIQPVDADGNTHVVVVTDNFTKWTRLEPVQSDDAMSVAKALLRATNGRRPVSVRSDGGPSYANAIMESVVRLMGATQVFSLPHVHTGNSVVERCNKEVLKHVSNLVLCDKLTFSALSTWGALLPLVENIINNSFHSSIGMAPAQLWFGREFVDCALPLLAPVPVRWSPALRFPFASWARVLADNQTALYAAAQTFAEEKLGRVMATRLRDGGRVFEEGQWVLERWPLDTPRVKTASQWQGPWRVVRVLSEGLLCVVEDTVRRTERTVSVNSLVHVDLARFREWSADALAVHLRKLAASKYPPRVIEEVRGWRLKSTAVGWVGLPTSFRRREAQHPSKFQFLVKWIGEAIPTIENHAKVRLSPKFDAFMLSVLHAP